MATQLFKDIAHLVTNSTVGDGLLGVVEDAAFVVSDGLISWVGSASDAPAAESEVVSSDITQRSRHLRRHRVLVIQRLLIHQLQRLLHTRRHRVVVKALKLFQLQI